MDANLLRFVELSQATQSQIEELLKVRNSDFVSSAMLNSAEINLWEHLNWTKSAILDATRKDFLLCLVSGQVVGYTSLRSIDLLSGKAEWTFFLAEEYSGLGVGRHLAAHTLNYGFVTLGLRAIFAKALQSNLNSQRFLRKLGFVPTDEFYPEVNEKHLLISMFIQENYIETYGFFNRKNGMRKL